TIACLSCNPRSMAFSPLLECRASVVPLPLSFLRELGTRLARCALNASNMTPGRRPSAIRAPIMTAERPEAKEFHPHSVERGRPAMTARGAGRAVPNAKLSDREASEAGVPAATLQVDFVVVNLSHNL